MQVPAISLLSGNADDISAFAEGTIARNLRYLRMHPSTPHPYAWGAAGRIRYHFELPGADWWTIPDCIAAGWADCKDLSCWLCAHERHHYGETVVAGVRFPRVVVVVTGPDQLHALVERACGCWEDPSIVLGMPVAPGGAPWLNRRRQS
jgi:hypothetical protein